MRTATSTTDTAVASLHLTWPREGPHTASRSGMVRGLLLLLLSSLSSTKLARWWGLVRRSWYCGGLSFSACWETAEYCLSVWGPGARLLELISTPSHRQRASGRGAFWPNYSLVEVNQAIL